MIHNALRGLLASIDYATALLCALPGGIRTYAIHMYVITGAHSIEYWYVCKWMHMQPGNIPAICNRICKGICIIVGLVSLSCYCCCSRLLQLACIPADIPVGMIRLCTHWLEWMQSRPRERRCKELFNVPRSVCACEKSVHCATFEPSAQILRINLCVYRNSATVSCNAEGLHESFHRSYWNSTHFWCELSQVLRKIFRTGSTLETSRWMVLHPSGLCVLHRAEMGGIVGGSRCNIPTIQTLIRI